VIDISGHIGPNGQLVRGHGLYTGIMKGADWWDFKHLKHGEVEMDGGNVRAFVKKVLEVWADGGMTRTRGKRASEDVNPSDLFNAPNHREVLEFADSGAITNDPEIAREAVREDNLDLPPKEVVEDAEKAPPTPTEIAKEPGGAEFSTLNRYVVTTEQPGALAKKGGFGFWVAELGSK
jgi:hypothetical protein